VFKVKNSRILYWLDVFQLERKDLTRSPACTEKKQKEGIIAFASQDAPIYGIDDLFHPLSRKWLRVGIFLYLSPLKQVNGIVDEKKPSLSHKGIETAEN